MEALEKLYEGKAKILYATKDPDRVIQYFKDDASAFNGIKKGTIADKGIINNQVSCRIFQHLEDKGIPTHFVKSLSDREMLVKKLDMIPVEVVMRNVAAGSLCKRMGVPEGTPLKQSIMEFYYKDDALGDPMINENHIAAFELMARDDVEVIKSLGFKINELMSEFFRARKILLVDFKLEFGRHKGRILLGDEISPDACRLWNRETHEKLDKDRFRFDLGQVAEKYRELHQLVCGEEK
ncbi:MAG: phosphoribosylaminoimidazolesuccinocarboxamide synthase [Nitrospinales bacterium]